MTRLVLLTAITLTLAVIIFIKNRKPLTISSGAGLVISKDWLATNPKPVTAAKDCRPADQTFLTFPEWFLVFSPEEQANYFNHKTSSSFPYMAHVWQMWGSYKIVNDQIKENFPVNTGYHFMIWVIATSTTVEYSVKALYETLIGRLTDTHEVITDEDKFNARYMEEYVRFIKDRPWYEFNFKNQLGELWRLPLTGNKWFRKIERRFYLTTELMVKWGYGKLIGLGTQTVYDEAGSSTVVYTDGMPGGFNTSNLVEIFDDQSTLLKLPRYDKFNEAAVSLARQGINFKEIAGNTSAILVSIITFKEDFQSLNNTKVVFSQPLVSEQRTRVVLAVPVIHLSATLNALVDSGITIEHIFDF